MLLALYEFGSHARGDADALSDRDVLAVVAGSDKADISSSLLHDRTEELAVSWYGADRLRKMFRDGDLFAWHLFLESRPVLETGFRLSDLGRPEAYSQAIPDIRSFREILSDIPAQLSDSPQNAAYELGVLYVCVRNIGMSASWHLCSRPNFTRDAPFRLPSDAVLRIDRGSYELAMRCRMASQRGEPIPRPIQASDVRIACREGMSWSAKVLRALELRAEDGCTA